MALFTCTLGACFRVVKLAIFKTVVACACLIGARQMLLSSGALEKGRLGWYRMDYDARSLESRKQI
jgi:hypothetical protein